MGRPSAEDQQQAAAEGGAVLALLGPGLPVLPGAGVRRARARMLPGAPARYLNLGPKFTSRYIQPYL
eukprot:SAG31_NODE_2493_length_5611_cov_8.195755_5_plen_67_part_00